jgi:hypothetical protein
MQRLPLWVAIVPTHELVRLLVTEPSVGTVLKGRLPVPQEPRSLVLLLEALSAWSGRPIRAALDADAEAVRADPTRWARWLGDLDGVDVTVQWVGATHRRRDRFFDGLGDFGDARRRIAFISAGQ